MITSIVNTSTLLNVAVADGSSSLYIRASVYSVSNAVVATVNLAHVSGGYYSGTWTPTIVGEYFIVYSAYTDSGYTSLFAKTGNKLFVHAESSIPALSINTTTIIGMLMSDGNSGLYPQADIYNASGSVVSSVALSSVSGGYYAGTWTPTIVGDYAVIIRVYSDSGHTTLFAVTEDQIQVYASGSVSGANVSTIVNVPPIQLKPATPTIQPPLKPLSPTVYSDNS